MNFLRFLYFAIYSVSLSKDDSDLRFNPAAFIVMFTQPAIDSMLGVFLNIFTSRNPVVANGTVLYARFDVWTYISVVLATIFAWIFFDRKRAEILPKFERSIFRKKALWGIVFFAFGFILFEIYLYTFNFFLALMVFVGVVFLGNYWVKAKILK